MIVFACNSGGDVKNVIGTLKSTSTSNPISSSPYPTIVIQGRSQEEFLTEFSGNNGLVANFTIHDVPTKQPVIFQVLGTGLDPIISFPFDLNKSVVVQLPALQAGTTQAITDEIEVILATSVTPTAGIIIGQLKSDGTSIGSCSPITSVQIKNKETGNTVTVAGPYYFNTLGHVVQATSFQDAQCNYVMANVLPGNYILDFIGGGATISSTEVVVLGGNVTFGMDVPQ